MRLLLLACLGGAIGSGVRYLLNTGMTRWLGPSFPWATLIANVTGCFAMGLLAAWLLGRGGDSQAMRVFLATGVLGGYTTFSAFSLDFAGLVQRGDLATAFGYAAGSVGLSLAGVFLGLWIMRTAT
jgi:CrcB protein